MDLDCSNCQCGGTRKMTNLVVDDNSLLSVGVPSFQEYATANTSLILFLGGSLTAKTAMSGSTSPKALPSAAG